MAFRKLRELMRLESSRDADAIASDYAATKVVQLDERTAMALAKREAGQVLTRRERIMLAAEGAGMTPEHQMQVLKNVSTSPGRNSLAQVSAVNAVAQLVGDHAKESSHEISVHVAIGALWQLATPDDGGSETMQERSALGITVDPTQVDD